MVDCGSLDAPANGSVDLSNGTTFGSTAIYSCDEVFELQGNSTRMCLLSGQWSYEPPTCDCELHMICVAYIMPFNPKLWSVWQYVYTCSWFVISNRSSCASTSQRDSMTMYTHTSSTCSLYGQQCTSHVHTHTHTHTHTYTYTCAHMHTCTHIHAHL